MFIRVPELFVLGMRTYRDANGPNTAPLERILGDAQARGLVDGLASSPATWKFVAADMTIGVQVPDGTAWEAVANGVAGPPSGREAELAPNTSPADGFQRFGEVEVEPGGGRVRVALRGQRGEELWSTTLDAAR